MTTLEKYSYIFGHLKVSRSSGGVAPHKPVLLLAIIGEFEEGLIFTNGICITPTLVARFKDVWNSLVINEIYQPRFYLPFYHLKTSQFWELVPKFGRMISLTSSNSPKSFRQLKSEIEYSLINKDLFELLIDPISRATLRNVLLETYFDCEFLKITRSILDKAVEQILNEPPAEYRQMAMGFDEEEIYIRSSVFKKTIPNIYNNSCSISGLRIMANDKIQMIDACHIIPFSHSHDDTISNGISLCPNLHRAFDRGLIAIDDNYNVVIKSFVENDNIYSIRQFEGVKIYLPENEKFHPSKENLSWHRNYFQF